MGRNFYKADDFQWDEFEDSGMIVCRDGEKILFTVYNEGDRTNMINAYHAGLADGEKEGRAAAQAKMRAALGVKGE